jgi:hypothetical protein
MSVILLISIVSFSLNIVASHSDPTACFYLPWNRLWELSSGAALAYFQYIEPDLPSRQTLARRRLPSWFYLPAGVRGAFGLTLLLVSIASFDHKSAYPGWWALIPCLGTLLLISAGPGGWVNRVILSNRLLVFIGLISYPLYLWHWPLLAFGRIALGSGFTTGIAVGLAMVAVVLAFMTYKYIEAPVRHARNNMPVVSGLCASMLVCVTLGFLVFSKTLPARMETQAVEKFVSAAVEDWLPTAPAVPGARRMRSAHWTVSLDGPVSVGSAARQVLFLGDSNMQQYYPRIAKVLSDRPLNSHSAVFAVGSGCGPAVMEVLRSRIPDALLDPCRKTIQRGIEYASNPSVERVVISANWYLYLGDLTKSGGRTAEEVLNDLRSMIAAFVKDGKRVYVVLNIPNGADLDPRRMIRRTVWSPGFTTDIHPPKRSDMIKIVGPIAIRLREIAQSTGAVVIDPMEFLCNATVCPVVSASGEPMYKDGGHLRPSYVRENVRYLDETVLDLDIKTAAQKNDAQVSKHHSMDVLAIAAVP